MKEAIRRGDSILFFEKWVSVAIFKHIKCIVIGLVYKNGILDFKTALLLPHLAYKVPMA